MMTWSVLSCHGPFLLIRPQSPQCSANSHSVPLKQSKAMDFDVVPYEDIVWGKKLGAGSFGAVYKGTYLGVDIAIKEVLPSTEYDVHKYFEREWRIMRECRHPNVVQFLGLSKAPEGDGRVFIISEFLPGGNLRSYILKHSLPFPWRLRVSFATDVARALAYLHARQCIHRDLKGENLLITANERIKVTDFGFARIAGRSPEEMRRMTYCGTDGYMSPEILLGHDFDLPTDVFSLGIIFIEIISRRLVDSRTFARTAPDFTLDPAEVQRRASLGCPPDFIKLALSCCSGDPASRPRMPAVLRSLRDIEVLILSRLDSQDGEHVGSIKLLVPGAGKRAMPDFQPPMHDESSHEETLQKLEALAIDGHGPDANGTWRTARWEESKQSFVSTYADASEMRGHDRLIPSFSASTDSSITTSEESAYSTDVVRGRPLVSDSDLHAATPFDEGPSSTLTVKGGQTPLTSPVEEKADRLEVQETSAPIAFRHSLADQGTAKAGGGEEHAVDGKASLRTHRFTVVGCARSGLVSPPKRAISFGSSLAQAFFPIPLGSSQKCAVCHKRIGQRPSLRCDDCNVIVHVKCSESAPRNCAQA